MQTDSCSQHVYVMQMILISSFCCSCLGFTASSVVTPVHPTEIHLIHIHSHLPTDESDACWSGHWRLPSVITFSQLGLRFSELGHLNVVILSKQAHMDSKKKSQHLRRQTVLKVLLQSWSCERHSLTNLYGNIYTVCRTAESQVIVFISEGESQITNFILN